MNQSRPLTISSTVLALVLLLSAWSPATADTGTSEQLTKPRAGEVAPRVAQSEVSEGIDATLTAYAKAINRGKARKAFRLLTRAQRRRSGGFREFKKSLRTVETSDVDISRVDVLSRRKADVFVSYTSRQDPRLGPDGQGCSLWNLKLSMLRSRGGVWRINGGVNIGLSPAPCDVVPDVPTLVRCSYDPTLGPNPLGMRAFISIVEENGDTTFFYEQFPGPGETEITTRSGVYRDTELAVARRLMIASDDDFEFLTGFRAPGLYAEIDAVLSCKTEVG